MKCLIVSDVDGVLTPPSKLFNCRQLEHLGHDPNGDGTFSEIIEQEKRWGKTYSDRDSFVLQRLKDEIVFISHDERNKHYIEYKKHKFLYVPHPQEKLDALKSYWNNSIESGEVEGDKDKPIYIYIGDDIFDYQCLTHALYGFIPLDANLILRDKLFHEGKLVGSVFQNRVTQLKASGGEGCINEAIYRLYLSQIYKDKNSVLHDYKIFSDLEEYFKS